MDTKNRPILWIIAGPNGSGKSSIGKGLLPENTQMVNPDEIAKGYLKGDTTYEDVAVKAGREAIKMRRNLIASSKSFAIETTLSNESIARLVSQVQNKGYIVNLLYISVDSPNISIARVRDRVYKGGHNVEIDDIVRRYGRSKENLLKIIPNINQGQICDNTGYCGDFLKVASIYNNKITQIQKCQWLENITKK